MRFKAEERGIVVLCQVTRTQKIANSVRFGGFGFHWLGSKSTHKKKSTQEKKDI